MLPLIASAAANAIDAFVAARGGAWRPTSSSPPRWAREMRAQHLGAQYVSCVDACHEITRAASAVSWTGATDGLRPVPVADARPACPPPSVVTPWTTPITWPTVWARRGVIGYSPFAPLANLTGMPAISIPFGLSRDGLPSASS